MSNSDPLSVAKAFLEAENAHDVDRSMSMFADNASVKVALEEYHDLQSIRHWQEALAKGNFHMVVVGDFRVDGNTVTWDNRLDLDMFKDLGLGTIEATSEMVVEDGKIVKYTFAPTPETEKRIADAIEKSKG